MRKPQRPRADGRSLARLLIGLSLVLAGWIVVAQSGFGVLERRADPRGVPMSFLVASESVRHEWTAASQEGQEPEQEAEIVGEVLPRLPGVIVTHGFGANRRIMSAYTHELAHAGYAVVSFDFAGHGDNTRSFERDLLQAEIDAAYEFLIDQIEVDPARIALIGHSMGAGAVIEAALRNPERYTATVAISPVDAEVTPLTPRNLQLQAGRWEPRFLTTAERLLRRAGGPSEDFANGRARELFAVPYANHVGILFRTSSHEAAVRWLDRALDANPSVGGPYADHRVLGWLIQVLGWMVVLSSMAVAYPEPKADRLRRPWYWIGAALAPAAAAVLLAAVAQLFDASRLFGVLVGGGVALWLIYAGALYMGLASRLAAPGIRQVVHGAVLFGILWLILGLSGEFVWLDWGLSGRRMWLWPLFALTSMPWFVAASLVQEESGMPPAPVWALHTAAMVVGLWLVARLVPGMELAGMLLPIVAFFLAVLSYVATRFNDPWVAGIGAGAFWGWLLVSAFPLVG